MIVADSGPILAFARIGRLELLRQAVEELTIPEAVYQEIVIRGRGRPGAAEVDRADWIRRQNISNPSALAQFPSSLLFGQREAIVLAQELGAQLLIDERRGRREAVRRGIQVIGSLRVLAGAKQRGLIDQARPVVEEMMASGYRFGERLIASFLQEIGE